MDVANASPTRPPPQWQRYVALPTTVYAALGGKAIQYLLLRSALTAVHCEGGGMGWCQISAPVTGYVWGGDLTD